MTLLLGVIGVLAFPIPDRSLICLSEAIYYEARGEGIEGQYAVAEVVLARVRSKRFPNTICEVVYQPSRNKERPLACAFSFTCNKKPRKIPKKEIYNWDAAVIIADRLIKGEQTNFSKGALHFLRCDIRHKVIWAKKLKLKAIIKNHCYLE